MAEKVNCSSNFMETVSSGFKNPILWTLFFNALEIVFTVSLIMSVSLEIRKLFWGDYLIELTEIRQQAEGMPYLYRLHSSWKYQDIQRKMISSKGFLKFSSTQGHRIVPKPRCHQIKSLNTGDSRATHQSHPAECQITSIWCSHLPVNSSCWKRYCSEWVMAAILQPEL